MKIFLDGEEVLISRKDIKKVNNLKWRQHKVKTFTYFVSHNKGVRTWLHRFILGCPKGKFVDHRSGDTLDNRRSNLRICTHTENNRNRKISKNNFSGYKGISISNRKAGTWRARIMVDWKRMCLGSFKNKEEAAKAYNRAALKYYGEFANLNKF